MWDADIMAGLGRREPAALAALYDRHGRLVYSLAVRMLRDGADAEEIVQDVFAQAWRQWDQFDRDRGTLATWLICIARSRCLDRLRRRAARPHTVDAPAAVDHAPDGAADAEAQLVSETEASRVRSALGELPVPQRVAIELAYFEGLSYRDVAERLETPVGTIKTRIRQGLMRLRHCLTETAR